MITFVYADDWIAVYDGPDCVYQGHSIEPDRVLELLGIPSRRVWAQGQADELGEFPVRLADVRPDQEVEL